jgi:hypothetical protein
MRKATDGRYEVKMTVTDEEVRQMKKRADIERVAFATWVRTTLLRELARPPLVEQGK